MLKNKFYFFCFFFFFNISSANENNTFLMLKNNEVNVRYGPSLDYPIKYVYKKINLPLKVIDTKENMRRIIDYKKNSGWIHRSQLKKSKSLIATNTKILFKKPTKYSKPLARIEEGRLLMIKECENNWCSIKTGKYSGWIENNNVWGNIK